MKSKWKLLICTLLCDAVLIITLISNFWVSGGNTKSSGMSSQMKGIFEQYFPVVLFIMMYMVRVCFENVD